MARSRGGSITLYFSEKELPVLDQLEAIRAEKGISASKLTIMALEDYFKKYYEENKKI